MVKFKLRFHQSLCNSTAVSGPKLYEEDSHHHDWIAPTLSRPREYLVSPPRVSVSMVGELE